MGELEDVGRANEKVVFLTTNWSDVLAAGRSESELKERALARLCQLYWYPIYAWIRRDGYSSHDAEDMAQSFFSHLLSKDRLSSVTPEKGRFRSFLLAALKNFLIDAHRKASSQKRGGRERTVSFHEADFEDRFQAEPVCELTPDQLFQRSWVIALLERVMCRLAEEQKGAGKEHVFLELKPHINKGHGLDSYQTIAGRLGMTEDAIKKAVGRLRRRYGVLLRAEVADTLTDPKEIESELAGLLEVWE